MRKRQFHGYDFDEHLSNPIPSSVFNTITSLLYVKMSVQRVRLNHSELLCYRLFETIIDSRLRYR